MERPPHAELAKIHLVAKWLPVPAIFPSLLLIVFWQGKGPKACGCPKWYTSVLSAACTFESSSSYFKNLQFPIFFPEGRVGRPLRSTPSRVVRPILWHEAKSSGNGNHLLINVSWQQRVLQIIFFVYRATTWHHKLQHSMPTSKKKKHATLQK